jgi:glucuronosyltransferase
MISSFPLKNPIENYSDIVLKYPANSGEIDFFSFREFSGYQMVQNLTELGDLTASFAMNQPAVQKLLKSDEKFDAVIVEVFWLEALYGFGAHFNCPVIGTALFSTSIWTNDLTLLPMEYSYVPHHFSRLTEKMNFFQRIQNLLTSQYENAYRAVVHYKIQVRKVCIVWNCFIGDLLM